MVGFFSFLLVVSAVAFVVSAVLLVVRTMKKKPKKPVAIMVAVSVLLFVISFVGIGVTYHPTSEQIAERERIAAEKEAKKAERERQKEEEAAKKDAEAAAKRETEAAQSESQAQTAEPSAPSESPKQSEPSESVSPSVPAESEPPAESENPAHSDAPSTTPSEPAEPKKLEVSLEVSVEENSGKPVFTIDTNLPNETNLMLTLSRGDYTGQTHVIVNNGVASSEEFSDKGDPLSEGEYLLTVSMSIPKLQPDAVRKVIGENGENMSGKYVLDSEIGDSMYLSGDFNFFLSGVAESDVPSEVESDTGLIRELFDALLENPDFEGGVISINPRMIDGEIYSWSIIDVVVPDAWYYLEEFQKERYCSNVGDYIKSALITGGVAENEAGCSVHFFDVAGEEVASSKMFGGNKIKK